MEEGVHEEGIDLYEPTFESGQVRLVFACRSVQSEAEPWFLVRIRSPSEFVGRDFRKHERRYQDQLGD